jgi:hypothetical protein
MRAVVWLFGVVLLAAIGMLLQLGRAVDSPPATTRQKPAVLPRPSASETPQLAEPTASHVAPCPCPSALHPVVLVVAAHSEDIYWLDLQPFCYVVLSSLPATVALKCQPCRPNGPPF